MDYVYWSWFRLEVLEIYRDDFLRYKNITNISFIFRSSLRIQSNIYEVKSPRSCSILLLSSFATITSCHVTSRISVREGPRLDRLHQQPSLADTSNSHLTLDVVDTLCNLLWWHETATMRQSLNLLAAVSRPTPSKLKKPAISLDHVSGTRSVAQIHESMRTRLIARIVHPKTKGVVIMAWDHESIVQYGDPWLSMVPSHPKPLYSFLQLEAPPSPTRDELRAYARHEFERNRDVSDLVGSPALIFRCTRLLIWCLIVSHTLSDFGMSVVLIERKEISTRMLILRRQENLNSRLWDDTSMSKSLGEPKVVVSNA